MLMFEIMVMTGSSYTKQMINLNLLEQITPEKNGAKLHFTGTLQLC